MSELVTVWDGSHQGRNRDLLCVALDPPPLKPTYKPWVTAQDQTRARYDQLHEDVIRALSDWHTIAELTELTGGTVAALNVVLQRLKRAEAVESREREATRRRRADGWKEYRLKASGPTP